jgi:hypothetical protein
MLLISQSHVTMDGQSASLSGVELPYGAHYHIFFLFDNCGSLDVGRPLWREDGSVIYSYNCSGTYQSSHSRVQFPQNSTIFYPHYRLPDLEGRSPCLYPPGTGWPSYTPGHWVPFSSPITTRRDYDGGFLTRRHASLLLIIQIQVILRPTISRPASLPWRQAPIWDPRPIFPILSVIIL